MKSELEIHHAHDLLDSVARGEICGMSFADLDGNARLFMAAVLDTLCWVLAHERGLNVDVLLKVTESSARELGYEPVKIQDEPVARTQ
jgi:hypothetical protein